MAANWASKTITISRQIGCLGLDVAQLLSESLGFSLVWRDLFNEAAKRIGAPEVALAAMDELGLLDICPSPEVCHEFRHALEQILHELANKGHVIIVGYDGPLILHGHPGVLHVRFIAPLHIRSDRIAARQGISLDCALAQIEASDRFRSRYIKRFYNISLDDPIIYDLTINTKLYSTQDAVSIILTAMSKARDNPLQDPISP